MLQEGHEGWLRDMVAQSHNVRRCCQVGVSKVFMANPIARFNSHAINSPYSIHGHSLPSAGQRKDLSKLHSKRQALSMAD
jgi:hypothetical protein